MENLVDQQSTSFGSDSRDAPEPLGPDPPPAKAPKGKHNLFTHFPKDANCEEVTSSLDGIYKVTHIAQT